MPILALDFMCGLGGATRGFLDAGINVLKGIDVDKRCQKTYERNNSPSKFLCRDIQELTVEDVLSGVQLRNEDKLAFIACAPCQPFSRAGKKNAEDIRTRTILAINNLVYKIKPDFVFVENVPGFQRFYSTVFQEFLRPYQELEYNYDCDMINLKEYGVPQNRRRFLFIASKDYQIALPEKTHGEGRLPYRTVRDAIEKYPPLEAGQEHPYIPNHVCSTISGTNRRRLKSTPLDGGSRTAWPEELVLDCHKNSSGHTDVYGRMKWDAPAPTLTCRCISISNGRFAHPEQNRGISVREAATLQTFGDDFIFYEPKTVAARHIGNAVPPLVACIFAKKIKQIASNNRKARAEFSKVVDTGELFCGNLMQECVQ